MATDYPGAVDGSGTLPNPSATSKTNSPSLSSGQSNQNDAIKALETKLGTGSSTPASNTFLVGNGAGSSAYSSLTSDQLASRLTDETGSGAAVFANTPTLITPKADTINEVTSSNGVTIDGLNVKDSKLNTNDSVVTANITDAAVTAPKMNNSGTWNSSWAWTSWTPTWTNVSGGTTNYAKYIQIGKTVHFRIRYTLAGAGVSGAATFSLPVAAHTDYALEIPISGTASFLDSGTNLYPAEIIAGSATTAILRPVNAASTNAVISANTSSTNPFTFGASDEIRATGMYEVA